MVGADRSSITCILLMVIEQHSESASASAITGANDVGPPCPSLTIYDARKKSYKIIFTDVLQPGVDIAIY